MRKILITTVFISLFFFSFSCVTDESDILDDSELTNDSDQGNSGDSGNSGNSGDSGNTGDSGDSGNSGNTGNTGNSGDSGNTGDTGNSGNTGDYGDNTPDPETETVKMVSGGTSHVCAIKDSGHLYCWGQGNRGQLGNNQTPGGDNSNPMPLKVGMDAWQSVCAMADATCGVKKNKEAFCWGHNADGQIANSLDGFTFQATGTPSPILLGAKQNQYAPLFCGGSTILAYNNDDLWGWGTNRMGQLANGQVGYDSTYPGGSATAYVPRLLNENKDNWPKFTKISISTVHACGISQDSDLFCWGSYDMGQFGDGKRGDGFDRYSYRSQAKFSEYQKPVKVNEFKWIDVASLSQNTCAVKDDGTLWCWGIAEWGIMGIGDVFASYTAGTPQDKVTYTEPFQQLVTNGECEEQFYSEDKSASQKRRYPPVCTKPVQVGTASDWVSVSGASNHVCAVNSGNELYCWGENEYGQIGNGKKGDVYSTLPSNYDLETAPVKIEGEFTAVSAGYNFTCAISLDKKLYCWGFSALGIPGFTGNKDNPQTTPVKISF